MEGFELDSEEKQEMERRLETGIKHVEVFMRRFLDHVGAVVEEPREGVLKIELPKDKVPLPKLKHLITFDPEVYSQVEEEGAELITPASPLFRRIFALSEQIAPLGLLRTRRATPYTAFHFHVHLEGMNYEWDDMVTVCIDDDGDALRDPPTVADLVEGLEEGKYTPVDPAEVTDDLRRTPQRALDAAPKYMRQQIAPKLDELAGAVEAGLRKTHERIHSYYEQMRDEIRGEEVKLRRRIGEINSRLWYTEDNIKLMKYEKERDVLTQELNQIKGKTQKTLEHLELEENERLAKEAERAAPKVRIALAAATRVVV